MNIYFIAFMSFLYYIRCFRFFSKKNKQNYINLTREEDIKKISMMNANTNANTNTNKKSRKSYICGFDEEGYDMRFDYAGDFNITKLDIFARQLKKMQLLRYLEDNNVSIHSKMNAINAYFTTNFPSNFPSNYSYNLHIYNDTLFNDFFLFGLD